MSRTAWMYGNFSGRLICLWWFDTEFEDTVCSLAVPQHHYTKLRNLTPTQLVVDDCVVTVW
jgi:hypothetical protein